MTAASAKRDSPDASKHAAANPQTKWDLGTRPHGFRLYTTRPSQDTTDGHSIGGFLFPLNDLLQAFEKGEPAQGGNAPRRLSLSSSSSRSRTH